MSIPSSAKPAEDRRSVALLYHELRQDASAYSYVITPVRLNEQLDMLASLPATAYAPIITFDDGHISNYTYALPALERFKRKAHFFVTAGWTGTRANYMDRHQLRALHDAGHSIGAHGWSHKLLTQCDAAELRHELNDAQSALEDAIGAPVNSLSLPGGRSNATVLHACRDAGYRTVWTSVPGPVDEITGPTVGRFNVLSGHSDAFLRRLLDPASGELVRAARISRFKAAAQRAIGDEAYARVWALLNRKEGGASDPSAQPATAERVRDKTS